MLLSGRSSVASGAGLKAMIVVGVLALHTPAKVAEVVAFFHHSFLLQGLL